MGTKVLDATVRSRVRRGRMLGAAVAAGMVASFTVTAALVPAAGAATFQVTSGLDDGSEGTLRWAVAQAAAAPGDDVVSIDPAVGTISLTDCAAGRVEVATEDQVIIEGGGATVRQTCADEGVLGTGAFIGDVVVRDLTVTGGDDQLGGGIFVNGTLVLERVVVTGNRAVDGGGVRGSTVTIVDSTIEDNEANVGGGVSVHGAGALRISGSTVERNRALNVAPSSFGLGGGVYGYGVDVEVFDSVIRDNLAEGAGGGFYVEGALDLVQSAVVDNTGTQGGGVRATTATVSRSDISGNDAALYGGLIAIESASIVDSTISGNFGGANVGGARSEGTMTVLRSRIEGNTSGDDAGGLSAVGGVTITDSAIVGNEAADGGGVGFTGGTSTVRNTTFARNFSFLTGSAMAIDGDLLLEQVTLDGNEGPALGGGAQVRAFATAWQAGACDGFTGVLSSAGYNVAADGGCGLVDPTDLVDVGDLGLGALGLNGGSTPNQVPQSGSPLLNRIPADDTRCTGTDQRGFARPQNGACDAGAVEVRAVSAVGTTVSVTGATPIDVDLHPLVTDPDGVLAVYEVSDVVGGSADGNDEGVVTYTPRPGFDGSGRFAFVVCSFGDVICTNSATVTITGPALPVSVTPRFTG